MICFQDSAPSIGLLKIDIPLSLAPQVSQIGQSACGATAVINALLALDSPHTTATVAEQARATFILIGAIFDLI